MMYEWKKAIVVGASSGIGEALVRRLTAQGCRVGMVARRADRLQQIADEINGATLNLAIPYTADVRDFDRAEEHFDNLVRKLAGLDLIIYAAGIMPKVGPTEYNTAIDKEIIEINLIGAIAWLNCAAKRFERAKGGTIVGIGSPSGDRGRRGNPAYGASKAGLECYLESLRNRLSQFGVSVVTVKPGPVETEMTLARGRLRGMIPCDTAANLILKAAKKFGKTAYIPWKWWLASKILRAIPSPIFRRMNV